MVRFIYYFDKTIKDTISITPLRTVLPFLSFKGLTQTYLVKTSMTHNKYLTPQFLEVNDPISAKSAAQI